MTTALAEAGAAISEVKDDATAALRASDLAQLRSVRERLRSESLQTLYRDYLDACKAAGRSEEAISRDLKRIGFYDLRTMRRTINDTITRLEAEEP